MFNKDLLHCCSETELPYKDMLVTNNVFQGTEEDRTFRGMTFTSMYQRDDTNIYWTGTYEDGPIQNIYISVRGNTTVNNFVFNSGGWSDGRIISDKYATCTGIARISVNEMHTTDGLVAP